MRALTLPGPCRFHFCLPSTWQLVGFNSRVALFSSKETRQECFFCRSNLEQTQTKGTISVKISLLLIETAIKLTLVVFSNVFTQLPWSIISTVPLLNPGALFSRDRRDNVARWPVKTKWVHFSFSSFGWKYFRKWLIVGWLSVLAGTHRRP